MGGLNTISKRELIYIFILMLIGLLPIVLLRWRINLPSFTDEEALSLGVNIKTRRIILIILATLMTSSAVAISGNISWVGLIVPHIAWLLVGSKFNRIFLFSLLLGALFLIVSDTVWLILTSIDLPLNILTSLLGVPFFIGLLLWEDRKR